MPLSDEPNRVLRASDLFRCLKPGELLPAPLPEIQYLELHCDTAALLELGASVI